MDSTKTPTNQDAEPDSSTHAIPGAKNEASKAADNSAVGSTSDAAHTTQPLPTLTTPLTPDQVVKRIAKLSQRGRLPGFERGEGEVLFTATLFGQPFDKDLFTRTIENQNDTTTLSFTTKLKPILPWTFGIVMALSIWPGVWFTDELCRTYFAWYDFATWMWYLPITILPLPWMIKGIKRKTQATTAESAAELIELIRDTIDGTTDS